MPATTAKPTRIERLRALAEHAGTPEHERALARKALARMLERVAEQYPNEHAAWMPNWQGEKYQDTRRMGLTEVTKMIRDEIRMLRKLGKLAQTETGEGALKLAEPIGDAPAEIKISVRQPHYGRIDIAITGIPESWGWYRGTDHYDMECWLPTDALAQFGRELRRLAGAYNYDNSDTQFDHFDTRYYLFVNAAAPGSNWASYDIGRH